MKTWGGEAMKKLDGCAKSPPVATGGLPAARLPAAPGYFIRKAFTLIELLVVIAIIGVMIGLLLAAIQKVRAAAYRIVCANNLHQLALAAQGYQNSFDALPPNFDEDPSRTDGSHNLFYGPMVRLLPYLELENVYRNFSFLYYDSTFPQGTAGVSWPNVPGGMTWQSHGWHRNPFNRPPYNGAPGPIPPPDPLSCPNPTGSTGISGQTWGAQDDFKVFSCPSQPVDHFSTGQGTAFIGAMFGLPTVDFPHGNPFWNPGGGAPACVETNSVYAPGAGTACQVMASTYSPGSYIMGRSDYVAVVGTFVDAFRTDAIFHPPLASKYHSLFNWPVSASLAHVPDGTSNTLLFSEFCGVYHTGNTAQPQLNGWAPASWTCNGITVAFGTCPNPNNSTALGGVCGDSAGLGSGAALGGWHNGFFQVAFADGSIRLLSLSVPQTLLYALAGYNDGEVLNNDF
jgi:prepilin-type N-terminal cleavage/methylation domain-containing protein